MATPSIKWFWPAIVCVLGGAGTVGGAFVGLFDSHTGHMGCISSLTTTHSLLTCLCCVCHRSAVITVSNAGDVVRAWSITDGRLLWEDSTSSASAVNRSATVPWDVQVVRDVDGDSADDVVLLTHGRVHLRSGVSGNSVWSYAPSKTAESGALASHLFTCSCSSSILITCLFCC
jgi:hypothetical protein